MKEKEYVYFPKVIWNIDFTEIVDEKIVKVEVVKRFNETTFSGKYVDSGDTFISSIGGYFLTYEDARDNLVASMYESLNSINNQIESLELSKKSLIKRIHKWEF